MTESKDDKGQPGDQNENGQGDKNTADKGGDDKGDQQKNADGFTPEQQEKINSLLAEERRKERAVAAKIKTELDALKTKDLPEAQQNKQKVEELSKRLAVFEARELANSICADLKIPKEDRAKYINHVNATDEEGIREQIKKLKADFAPPKTGTGSNPAKTGKPGKYDNINQFIRSRGKMTG
jgi:hypothetical protein